MSLSGVTIQTGSTSSGASSTSHRATAARSIAPARSASPATLCSAETSPAAWAAVSTPARRRAARCRSRATFSKDNSSSVGGAIFAGSPALTTITGSTFTGDTSSSPGGAVYAPGTGGLTIDSSVFTSNTGLVGGALNIDGAEAVAVTGSTFTGDNAGFGGGAINDLGSTQMKLGSDRFTGNSSKASALDLDSRASGAAYTLAGDALNGNTASGGMGGAILWESGTSASAAPRSPMDRQAPAHGLYASSGGALSAVDTLGARARVRRPPHPARGRPGCRATVPPPAPAGRASARG